MYLFLFFYFCCVLNLNKILYKFFLFRYYFNIYMFIIGITCALDIYISLLSIISSGCY